MVYYNSSYGLGFEGIVNYANILTNYWFVPFFLAFVLFALITTFSKDRQFPMSAIIAFSLVIVMMAAFVFKLVTVVNESVIYIIIAGLGIAVAWGIWQAR
jgi:riboflavin transporter FmnP